MKPERSFAQMTRAEQETTTEARRLTSQIEDALTAVARRTNETDELEGYADRIERAARDLSVALRELAHERRQQEEQRA